MTTEIAEKKSENIDNVRGLLEKMKSQIQMALPRHMTATRMIRIALTSIQKTPRLLECAPITLVGAVVQAAQLGLEPDDGTGKAYLIPFWNGKKGRLEVQFMAGYKGLVELARRSGEIRSVIPRTVHEKDQFAYQFGTDAKIEHRPTTEEEVGKPTHYYAVAKYKVGGDPDFDVMTLAQIFEVYEGVKKKNKGNAGVWDTNFDEMAKKTVVRRLCKHLPSSPELQQAIDLDERGDAGIPQDLGAIFDPKERTPDAEAGPEPQRASEAVVTDIPVIGFDERKSISDLMKKHKIDAAKINDYLEDTWKVPGIEKIPARQHSKIYDETIKWLQRGGQDEIPFGE